MIHIRVEFKDLYIATFLKVVCLGLCLFSPRLIAT